MNSMGVLKQNLEIVADFSPMREQDQAQIRGRCRNQASDGHLELFKTTTKYDGKIGREQHGYRSIEELPA